MRIPVDRFNQFMDAVAQSFGEHLSIAVVAASPWIAMAPVVFVPATLFVRGHTRRRRLGASPSDASSAS